MKLVNGADMISFLPFTLKEREPCNFTSSLSNSAGEGAGRVKAVFSDSGRKQGCFAVIVEGADFSFMILASPGFNVPIRKERKKEKERILTSLEHL